MPGLLLTSITLNTDYNAKRHRDKHNDGSCVVRAWGDFNGGKLLYDTKMDEKWIRRSLP